MDPGEIGRALANLRPVKKLACAQCGKSFEGRVRARFCSPQCRWDFWNQARSKAGRAERSEKTATNDQRVNEQTRDDASGNLHPHQRPERQARCQPGHSAEELSSVLRRPGATS